MSDVENINAGSFLDFKEVQNINKSFNSIKDLFLGYYGKNGLVSKAVVGQTTANYVNNVYGRDLFMQLNNLHQTYGVLPKSVWKRAGYRAITSFSSDIGSGGTSDGGDVGTDEFPGIKTVNMSIKLIQHPYSMSFQKLARTGDDDVSFEDLRDMRHQEHVISISRQIVADVDTPAGNNFESIDRVCSSQSEGALLSALTDNDIYDIDRSATTEFDAYVDHKAASGDDNRILTRDMIKTGISSIYNNSGMRPKILVTGGDTADAIDRIYQGAHRLLLQKTEVKVGPEGISTRVGNDSGFQVSTVENGIPIIVDDNIVKDGTGLSRIYFLNTDKGQRGEYNLSMSIAIPTLVIESNRNSDIFATGFKKRGVVFTAGELKCTKFSAQGKIRDITEA